MEIENTCMYNVCATKSIRGKKGGWGEFWCYFFHQKVVWIFSEQVTFRTWQWTQWWFVYQMPNDQETFGCIISGASKWRMTFWGNVSWYWITFNFQIFCIAFISLSFLSCEATHISIKSGLLMSCCEHRPN